MISKRFWRTLKASGMSGLLAAIVFAMPLSTLAATPNWDGTLTALPSMITPGDAAGYRATIFNPGPSNVSQLYVSVTFSQPYDTAASWDGSNAPVFVRATMNGQVLGGACGADPSAGPLTCSLGALRAGSTAAILVAYATDGSTQAAGVTVSWTTTGLGSGSGDNSHGDVLFQYFDNDPDTEMIPAPTQMVSGSAASNFDGGFTTAPQTPFSTSAALGPGNLFGTSLRAAAAFIPVTILDDTTYASCPAGQTCFGNSSSNAVQLSINEGEVFTNPFSVVVQVYKDAVPAGSNGKKATVVHYFDDPERSPETISNDCPKNATPTTTCRSIGWDGRSGIYTITIWLFENGYVKFH